MQTRASTYESALDWPLRPPSCHWFPTLLLRRRAPQLPQRRLRAVQGVSGERMPEEFQPALSRHRVSTDVYEGEHIALSG